MTLFWVIILIAFSLIRTCFIHFNLKNYSRISFHLEYSITNNYDSNIYLVNPFILSAYKLILTLYGIYLYE